MQRFAISSLSLALVFACAKSEAPYESMAFEAEPPPAPPAVGMGRAMGGAPASSTAAPAARNRRMEKKKVAPMDAEAGDDAGTEGQTEGAADVPKQKRMVHYNGFLKLKTPRTTETLQQASEIADAAGGYVESLTETAVTVRVPAAKFRQVYDELAKIGDVVERSMTAHDVTDAFVATDLRVKTLRASRDRLIALLGKAKKAREKLRLLREIRRLTEQVDQLEMQLNTIADLAAMSRLTVEVQPKQVHVESAADEPIAAFRWIHRLSPFRRQVASFGDLLELRAPEGFVELDHDGPWIAESADGAVMWASIRENKPAGETAFWVEALRKRFERIYGNAEVKTIGNYQVVRVVDSSETAYRYLMGLRANGDDLELVEIYYPTPEHEKRYEQKVAQVLAGGAA